MLYVRVTYRYQRKWCNMIDVQKEFETMVEEINTLLAAAKESGDVKMQVQLLGQKQKILNSFQKSKEVGRLKGVKLTR